MLSSSIKHWLYNSVRPWQVAFACACRGELVSGKALPTQDELLEWNESQSGSHDSTSSSIKGVPYFYLTVLCNQVRNMPGDASKDIFLSACIALG